MHSDYLHTTENNQMISDNQSIPYEKQPSNSSLSVEYCELAPEKEQCNQCNDDSVMDDTVMDSDDEELSSIMREPPTASVMDE